LINQTAAGGTKWTSIDCKAEESNEILMSCQHTSSATGRFGNRTYSYFNPQFSNFSGGWTQRGQYIGGMDFQRCRPTEYAYAIFDNVNDSRMWKTFKTVYGLNNIASKADDVVATNGITADQVPTLGDQGIIFILNKKSDNRFKDATNSDCATKLWFNESSIIFSTPNPFPIAIIRASNGIMAKTME
jgi:hypothetical protein